MKRDRYGYFFSKIKRAWSDRTLWDKSTRFLMTMINRPIEVLVGYLRLSREDRRLNLKDGFADHRQKEYHHHSCQDHLRRIIAAYKASKSAQLGSAAAFQIQGLWAEWIAVNHRKLIDALTSEDISVLSTLFENFHRETFAIGTGGYDNYMRYRTLLGSFYIKYVWSKYRDKLSALDFDFQKIRFPMIGNPAGVFLNGQIVSIETLRHAYHALEIFELLRGAPGASIVEIGAGLGGQAYQTIQMSRGSVSKYVIFDIPEVAAISSYFLLSAFPEKRVRLFGEGSVNVTASEKYDIGIFPHFAITELSNLSVDLFYNSCSFSEMDAACSKEYLRIIELDCRKYFMHDNHDTVLKFRDPDGAQSVNVIGSKLVPNPALFRRIFKKPRVHGLPEDRSFVHYEYLYERL